MGHARSSADAVGPRHGQPAVDAEVASSLAATFHALAAPSRLHLLAVLRDGSRTVGELVEAVGMEQSAVSHQLRLLREAGFVISERQGRHIVYQLFDDHVTGLLDQALYHAEHVRLGLSDTDVTAHESQSATR